MKYKIAIWGIGNDFKIIYPKVELEVQKGNIEIRYYVDSNKNECFSGLKIINPEEMIIQEIDYVIVSSQKYYNEICAELKKKGLTDGCIINAAIFLNKDFDFKKYKDNGWINDNLFGNIFSDYTYEDRERQYKRKNLKIRIGRKSYIGRSYIVDGGNHGTMTINIGNYSSIAWDCKFDMGLNLDHDYNKVMNYGMSHLSEEMMVKIENECNIDIGHDVWIGYDVVLKANCSVGDGAVIAAHSVVVGDVPPFTIVGGNPARVIKKRFPDEIIKEITNIGWWYWPVKKLLSYKNVLENPVDFITAYRNRLESENKT